MVEVVFRSIWSCFAIRHPKDALFARLRLHANGEFQEAALRALLGPADSVNLRYWHLPLPILETTKRWETSLLRYMSN